MVFCQVESLKINEACEVFGDRTRKLVLHEVDNPELDALAYVCWDVAFDVVGADVEDSKAKKVGEGFRNFSNKSVVLELK